MDPHGGDIGHHDLDRLIRKVREQRGLDLMQYRRAYTERRLAARMRILSQHSYRQYERYLDEHPEEYAQLLDTLTINVTDFFRDPIVFDVLRRVVIPALVEERRGSLQRTIRVWSAGCATGEETYSVAMSFLAALDREPNIVLSVFGTDIDPKVIAQAKAGVYDIGKLGAIPMPEQRRFVDRGETSFAIRPEVRQHVKFRRLNLFQDEPIKIVDVLLCRNVFIYFTKDQQARVLDRFWDALRPGGFLILGRTERIGPERAGRFELVSARERVYRKPHEAAGDGA